MFMGAPTISILYYCVSIDDHKLLLKKQHRKPNNKQEMDKRGIYLYMCFDLVLHPFCPCTFKAVSYCQFSLYQQPLPFMDSHISLVLTNLRTGRARCELPSVKLATWELVLGKKQYRVIGWRVQGQGLSRIHELEIWSQMETLTKVKVPNDKLQNQQNQN